MSPWNWRPERPQGIWRYGDGALRPFVAAAPYLTVGLLVVLVYLLSGTLTAERGILFDLPSAGLAEGEATGLVALVMPTTHATLVFFDDSRYTLGEGTSDRALRDHLTDRAARAERKTLLVLADRRVAGGELMKFAALARQSGFARILFAEKKATGGAN